MSLAPFVCAPALMTGRNHMLSRPSALLFLTLLTAACIVDDDDETARRTAAQADSARIAMTLGEADRALSPDELERGRMDASWREVVQLDSAGAPATAGSPERWEQLSAEQINTGPMHLPLGGDVAGASVVRVQTLLDRALFSPGVIDGRWGKNVEKAVYWLQKREGLPATGQVDSTTFRRLVQLAGNPQQLLREHRLTADDVAGPFVAMPQDIYDAHELDCTCYESLSEKLAERFHVARELLAKLNPDADLDALRAGDQLIVPAVRDEAAAPRAPVADIVVSVRGSYLHAKDAQGRILYHFPTTLGSGYDPEEGEAIRVNSATPDPWWHLQPELLHTGDPNRPDVKIPPGPNNAVGTVWIDLSKEHYGIHGTAHPETIGYATSSGCVRLTNWDVEFLGERVDSGVPVRFRDVPSDRAGHAAGPQRREGPAAVAAGPPLRPDTTRGHPPVRSRRRAVPVSTAWTR